MGSRKKMLLDAAKEVFAEKGYHDTRVSDIVQRAGVAQGTFYLYFKNKRSIFNVLMELFFHLVFGTFRDEEIEHLKTKEAYAEHIKAIYRDIFQVLKDNKELTVIFLRESRSDTEVMDLIQSFTEKLIAWVAAYLEIGVKQGILRPKDPAILTQCLLGMIMQNAYYWFMLLGREDVEVLIEEMADFELFGILNH